MYTAVAEMLSDRPAKILEVGFGIGYGLKTLIDAKCCGRYLGIEIEKDCCEFVEPLSKDNNLKLINGNWLTIDDSEFKFLAGKADFSLCIEVIEHIASFNRQRFVARLFDHTDKALFLSTPNINTNGHGVMTAEETRLLILSAGFKSVVYIEWQWTTFFICNP